jgi:hypothetical protein
LPKRGIFAFFFVYGIITHILFVQKNLKHGIRDNMVFLSHFCFVNLSLWIRVIMSFNIKFILFNLKRLLVYTTPPYWRKIYYHHLIWFFFHDFFFLDSACKLMVADYHWWSFFFSPLFFSLTHKNEPWSLFLLLFQIQSF